mgnify:CR=1 FL=1
MPLHRVWEYRDIGRLFITVGGERVIIGVLRWGWVEVILRVSLEVILLHLLHPLLSFFPLEASGNAITEAPAGLGCCQMLVSLDLSANDDFHSAFWLVVILSGLIALGPLFLDSPRKPPEPEDTRSEDVRPSPTLGLAKCGRLIGR